MLSRITAPRKGIITGVLMIVVVLAIYYSGKEAGSSYQYAVYALYGLGVIWTLLAYRQSSEFTGKFGDLFMQGFRCFIVVTLIMVAFTFIFNRAHPEFAEAAVKAYKEQQIKEGGKLPSDIDKDADRYKKTYNTVLVYGAIFGYLIIGAGVTAVGSVLLMRRS